MDKQDIELHPLRPFIPELPRLLMLGSFPPQHKRWSMEFFYPNIQNDMWRIIALIFFNDKNYFYDVQAKRFKLDVIIPFLQATGIAFFDTASAIRRLKNNASDQFLEVVTETDIHQLVAQMPTCHAIATTGKKAAEVLCHQYDCELLGVGESRLIEKEKITLYRMPSSSRSYPLSLDKKTAFYRQMFLNQQML